MYQSHAVECSLDTGDGTNEYSGSNARSPTTAKCHSSSRCGSWTLRWRLGSFVRMPMRSRTCAFGSRRSTQAPSTRWSASATRTRTPMTTRDTFLTLPIFFSSELAPSKTTTTCSLLSLAIVSYTLSPQQIQRIPASIQRISASIQRISAIQRIPRQSLLTLRRKPFLLYVAYPLVHPSLHTPLVTHSSRSSLATHSPLTHSPRSSFATHSPRHAGTECRARGNARREQDQGQ